MTPEQVLSTATSLKGIGVIVAVSALIFGWIRAGSAHFLRERVWTLLGGSKDFHDIYLNEQWKKVRDLEAVRYRTGISFRSGDKATETFAWLHDHKIPIDDFLKASKYFNSDGIKIRKPNLKIRTFGSIILICILFLMMPLLFMFGESKYALLKIKETHTFIWTDGKVVKSWDRRSWEVGSESCKVDQVPVKSDHDKAVICELITSDAEDFIEKSLSSQKNLSGILVVFFMITIGVILRLWDRAHTAQKIYKKTQDFQSGQRELNLSQGAVD